MISDPSVKQRVDVSPPNLLIWRPRRDLNPCYRRERAKEAFCSGLHGLVCSWISLVFMRATQHSRGYRFGAVGIRLQADMSPQCHRSDV